jgi:hypothetical protein
MLLTSLLFVAVGSLLVAVAELPAWFVALAALAAFGVGVWLTSAWSQHRVWTAQLDDARQAANADNATTYPMTGYKLRCAEHCARWSWALRNPFSAETWPSDFRRRESPPG